MVENLGVHLLLSFFSQPCALAQKIPMMIDTQTASKFFGDGTFVILIE